MSDVEYNEEVPVEEARIEEPHIEEPHIEEPHIEEPHIEEAPIEEAPVEENIPEVVEREPEQPKKEEESTQEYNENEMKVSSTQKVAPKETTTIQQQSSTQKLTKQTSNAPSGDIPTDLNSESAWKAICTDTPSINWYLFGVDKKLDLTFKQAGQKGLEELTNLLKTCSNDLLYGLLRVNSNDKGGSKRAKFVYIRFVGSKVGFMQRAKMTPNLGKIGNAFPVKHLTYDLTEDLSNFTVGIVSKEMLRVGGAHKPDSFDFGPNQVHICS